MLMELRFILWMYLYILLGHERVVAKVNTTIPGEIPTQSAVKIDSTQQTTELTGTITRSQILVKDNTEQSTSEDNTMTTKNKVPLKIKDVTLQSMDYLTTADDKEITTNQMLKKTEEAKHIKTDGISVILNDTKAEKDDVNKKLLTDILTTASSVNVSDFVNKHTEKPQEGHDQVTTIATSKHTNYLTSHRSNSRRGNSGTPTILSTLLPGDTDTTTAQPYNVYTNTIVTTSITDATSAKKQNNVDSVTEGRNLTTKSFQEVDISNDTNALNITKRFTKASVLVDITNDSVSHNFTSQDRTTQSGVKISSNKSWDFISADTVSSKVQPNTADNVTDNPVTLSVNGSRTVLSTNLSSTAESAGLMTTNSQTPAPTVVNYTQTVTLSDNRTIINNNTTSSQALPMPTKHTVLPSSQTSTAQNTNMSSDTTLTQEDKRSTKSGMVVTETQVTTIIPSHTVTQHRNFTHRPTDEWSTSQTMQDISSTTDTIHVTMQFTNEYSNKSTVTSVIPNNTLSSGGLSKTAKIGIGVGSMVLFWIILGPIVCLICCLKDKNSSGNEDEDDEKPRESFSQTLMEQYIMTELARGREKKYQTTLTNECEIRKLDDSSEYEQSVDAEVTSF